MTRREAAIRDRVLLREDPLARTGSGLAVQIERLGFRAELVTDDGLLRRALDAPDRPRALLLDVGLARAAVDAAVALANRPSRGPEVTVVAVGARPDPGLRASLRDAGVTWAAFGSVDDATLRFQINRSFAREPDDGPTRQERRAPLDWEAGLRRDGPPQGCRLANLSRGGAFVQTPRPLDAGESFELDVPLPSGPVRLEAVVRHTHRADTARAPRTPSGMGVTFTQPDPDVWRGIDQVLAQRCAGLRL